MAFITHSVDEAVLLGDRVMVMTAQPGRVKRFVPIPLARPRGFMELQGSPEYGNLVHLIWANLRDEVLRARSIADGLVAGGTSPTAAPAGVPEAGHEPANRPCASPSKPMSLRMRDRILGIASPLALLIVWELAARFGLIDTRFFPAPSSIFAQLVEMLKSGELMTHTLASLNRLFWGTLIGGVPALVLGVVMGLNRAVRAVLIP